MATGGIFTIITNDGKQDRMLMATALLHERLRAINAFKMQQNGGQASDMINLPQLYDIEKTHILFTNAHFKPFAAIGFEYNKVNSSSGSPSLGSSLQFSIPQFGDFFHDIACHVILNQPTALTSDSTNTSVGTQPLMRWCHFPGERLLKQVMQEVNGNPLDKYTYHATNMHREYRVAPNKKTGWFRCVGQELPEEGWIQQPTWDYNNVAVASVTNRIRAEVDNGNQTPTTLKTAQLEMFIPLLFWYNKDVRLAVPSVAIPYGQRFINIDLASADELVGEFPRGLAATYTWASPGGALTTTGMLSRIELYINNIFVNPEVHKIYIKRVGFSLIRVHREQVYTCAVDTDEILLQQMKWPIEYMFVGMKVKDYHAGSTAALKRQHLDKWQTFTTGTTTTYTTNGQDVLREHSLGRLGVGTIAIATDGIVTFAGADYLARNVAVHDLWKVHGQIYRVTAVGGATDLVTTFAAMADVNGIEVTTGAVTGGTGIDVVAATTDVQVVTWQGMSVQTTATASNLTSVSIKAHGIDIYDVFPIGFYNAYLSYHFGGPNINTPEDKGLAFIPFCLYPGTYQPSGHINISRAREFYLAYVSPAAQISAGTNGSLVVVASAINFLLISDGSAVLRYST
jgi:hypothetical protein